MGRQIFLGRVILVAYFLGSVCIPLDHTCLENPSASLNIDVGQKAASGRDLSHVSPHSIPPLLDVRQEASQNRTCLACLWSQTLQLQKSMAEIGIPQIYSSGAILFEPLNTALPGLFSTDFKRGPPRVSPF